MKTLKEIDVLRNINSLLEYKVFIIKNILDEREKILRETLKELQDFHKNFNRYKQNLNQVETKYRN